MKYIYSTLILIVLYFLIMNDFVMSYIVDIIGFLMNFIKSLVEGILSISIQWYTTKKAVIRWLIYVIDGGSGQNWTGDTWIYSLYKLSFKQDFA
jgi:hypothetical protein